MFADLQVKLSDFGLTRRKQHTSNTWAGLGAVGGTVPYTAPEVPGKGKLKTQTCEDIMAMCLVLIEWYTGEQEEDRRKQVKKQEKEKQNYRQSPELPSNVPACVREVLTAGLSHGYTAGPSARDMKERFGIFHTIIYFYYILLSHMNKSGNIKLDQPFSLF